jgi:hypothetical protein
LRTVEDKVWLWVIPSTFLTEIRGRHRISSAARREDGVHLRIVADISPHADAQPTSPTLEDAYLYQIANDRTEKMI